MNDRDRALPFSAVLQVADARRRRRDRVRAVAGPAAAGLLTAGFVVSIVVAVQAGAVGSPPVVPAAPPWAVAPPVGPGTTTSAPPFGPSVSRLGYVEELAAALPFGPAGDRGAEEAQVLAEAWGVALVPDAQAITAKAALLGEPLALDDPAGGDRLVDRFAAAGYTEQDAVALAEAWSTDERTASILGALVAEAG